MTRRLCHALLTSAARRWPAELRGEMLAEWRAELHATPGTVRRLRYAASLATSRPHRERAIVVRPGRNFAHAVLSLLLVGALPVLYLWLAVRWSTHYDKSTIVWQAWVGAGGIVAAVVLGIVCAGVTSGVTQLIRPMLVPLWTIGIAYATMVAVIVMAWYPNRATLIDLSCWALSAVVLGTMATFVARAGRALPSWMIVVIAVAVSFWFANMHGALSHFNAMGMDGLFGGRFLPGYAFAVGTNAMLHVTIFLLVYAHRLVRRHRAVQGQLAVPPLPA
jgi:hypothetical protein